LWNSLLTKKSYKTIVETLAADFAVAQFVLNQKYIYENTSENSFLPMKEAAEITILPPTLKKT
jgi:hypothetical protein